MIWPCAMILKYNKIDYYNEASVYRYFFFLNDVKFKLFSIFTKLFNISWYWTLDLMPNIASHALLKRNIHVERSQTVIETNLSTERIWSVFLWSLHSGSPYCVGSVLKQNNFASMARPLHVIFARFAEKNSKKSLKYKDIQPDNVQMLNNGSRVSTTFLERTGRCVVMW